MKSNVFRLFSIISLVLLTGLSHPLAAQEEDYRLFTDKKAQAIEARLLSISTDKSLANIRRKDGREFELTILSLCLDDQQFLNSWLESNPIQSDYQLEISVDKRLEKSEKLETESAPNVKWLTDQTSLEFTIQNASRNDLNHATAEYYIIIEQNVYASPMDPASQQLYGVPEWWHSNDPASLPKRRKKAIKALKAPLWIRHGEAKLEKLAYNRSTSIKTDTFPLREISSGTRAHPKDSILGIIIRITDVNGKEVSLFRSTEHKLLKKSWESFSKMPPGDASGAPLPVAAAQ